MAFGSGKRIEELEGEVTRLKQWVAHLGGTEAVRLNAEIAMWRGQLASLQAEATAAQAAASQARSEEDRARSELLGHADTAVLQEAGYYVYNHPLSDAVAYKDALSTIQARMKQMIRAGTAIEAASAWTVNNSAAQGRKMVKDMSTLMLRAYNAEADSIVRAVRPHALSGAKGRLEKSALAIERLGKMMSIRVSPVYHKLRLHEIEMTCDFLVKKQEEKEAERERRAELREQKRAAAEMLAELSKLRKEQEHYRNLLGKLDPQTDAEAIQFAEAKLAEIGGSIDGVERRAANIRTGHVYVISNLGAFGADMVKIGMTRRLDPYARVVELGDASVPFRFDIHAMIFSEDAVGLELQLHQALAHRKVNYVNPRREFFYATPAEVRDELSKIAGPLLLEFTEEPEALEWRASGSIDRETPDPASDRGADVLEALSDASGGVEEPDDDLRDEPQADAVDLGDPDADVDSEDADTDADKDNDPEEPVSGGAGLLGDQQHAFRDAPHALAEQLESAAELRETTDAVGGAPPAPTGPAPHSERGSVAEPTHGDDSAAEGTAGQPLTEFPAGWYPDVYRVKRLRYWDGTTWTAHTAD